MINRKKTKRAQIFIASLTALTYAVLSFVVQVPSVGAAPNVACEGSGFEVFAIDNSQSGDSKEVMIVCISQDGASQSAATLNDAGTDVEVICEGSGTLSTEAVTQGEAAVKAICSTKVVSYFNGTTTKTVGATTTPTLEDTLQNTGSGNSNGTPESCREATTANSGDGCSFLRPVDEGRDDQVNSEGKYQCGQGEKAVKVGFNFGCRGDDYPGDGDVNPIVDIAFAIFRFLSAGVGIVVVGVVMVAGVQYTMSRGNPQAIEGAIKRVANGVTALILYIFLWAIANFIVPGGMFL